MKKFIVCTMYCGELDMPHHIEALKNQGVEVDHRVFSHMSEVNAHNAVYQTFNQAGPEWIRAKVDADVVLHPDALSKINVRSNGWVDPVTDDFFTDAPLHAGVAIYGPGVKFLVQTHTLKCDRNVAMCDGPTHYGSIGTHCKYADELTGFRYGFHRGLKSQLPVYDSVVRAHRKHGDRVRLMAIRGFELAQSDRYRDYHLGHAPVPTTHNYGEELNKLFEEFSGESVPELVRTWR